MLSSQCCLVLYCACTHTRSTGLQIPQSQLHQLLPLGTNATVQCIPEPPESRPTIRWTVDGASRYDEFVTFYNSQGIFVYQTADNISYTVVEGRHGQKKNRRLTCGATDDNGVPVISAIAMIEFYGEYVSLCLYMYMYMPPVLCVHYNAHLVLSVFMTVAAGSHTHTHTPPIISYQVHPHHPVDLLSIHPLPCLHCYHGTHPMGKTSPISSRYCKQLAVLAEVWW